MVGNILSIVSQGPDLTKFSMETKSFLKTVIKVTGKENFERMVVLN